jgi:hypothetical protein
VRAWPFIKGDGEQKEIIPTGHGWAGFTVHIQSTAHNGFIKRPQLSTVEARFAITDHL